MKLGSSMRRRRGGSSGKKPPRKPPGRRKPPGSGSRGRGPSLPLPGGLGRLLLLGIVAAILGSGTGYLYATQVVFPEPEREVANFQVVPDFRGFSLNEAWQELEAMGLGEGRVDSIQHPDVEEGRILGQTPLPGQLAAPGGEVELTVSLGPERRPVPDVTRLLASRAITVLQTTGFEVEVDSVEADAPAGRVVETEPEAGEEVTLPSPVRMVVSLGPPLVELPDLVGMQEEAARVVLDSLGLEVGEVEARFRFGFSQGEVLGQLPEAGEEVPRGSVVRLEVGRRGFLRDPDG